MEYLKILCLPNTQFCVKITQLKDLIFKYLLIPIVKTTSTNKEKINPKMASQKRSKTKISFADTTKNTESFETKTSDISLHSNFSNKSGNSQKEVTLQNIDRTKINKQQIRKLPNLGQQGLNNLSKRNKKKNGRKSNEDDDPDNESNLNSDEEQEIFRQKLEKLQLFQEANAKATKTTKNVQKNLLEKTKILGKLGGDPSKNLTPKALRQILENLSNRKSITRIGQKAASARMASQNKYSSRRVSNKTSNLSNFEGHSKDQDFTNEKELTSTIARNLLSDLKTMQPFGNKSLEHKLLQAIQEAIGPDQKLSLTKLSGLSNKILKSTKGNFIDTITHQKDEKTNQMISKKEGCFINFSLHNDKFFNHGWIKKEKGSQLREIRGYDEDDYRFGRPESSPAKMMGNGRKYSNMQEYDQEELAMIQWATNRISQAVKKFYDAELNSNFQYLNHPLKINFYTDRPSITSSSTILQTLKKRDKTHKKLQNLNRSNNLPTSFNKPPIRPQKTFSNSIMESMHEVYSIQHPDQTKLIYYPNGGLAILQNVMANGSLQTLVFDEYSTQLIACFGKSLDTYDLDQYFQTLKLVSVDKYYFGFVEAYNTQYQSKILLSYNSRGGVVYCPTTKKFGSDDSQVFNESNQPDFQNNASRNFTWPKGHLSMNPSIKIRINSKIMVAGSNLENLHLTYNCVAENVSNFSPSDNSSKENKRPLSAPATTPTKNTANDGNPIFTSKKSLKLFLNKLDEKISPYINRNYKPARKPWESVSQPSLLSKNINFQSKTAEFIKAKSSNNNLNNQDTKINRKYKNKNPNYNPQVINVKSKYDDKPAFDLSNSTGFELAGGQVMTTNTVVRTLQEKISSSRVNLQSGVPGLSLFSGGGMGSSHKLMGSKSNSQLGTASNFDLKDKTSGTNLLAVPQQNNYHVLQLPENNNNNHTTSHPNTRKNSSITNLYLKPEELGPENNLVDNLSKNPEIKKQTQELQKIRAKAYKVVDLVKDFYRKMQGVQQASLNNVDVAVGVNVSRPEVTQEAKSKSSIRKKSSVSPEKTQLSKNYKLEAQNQVLKNMASIDRFFANNDITSKNILVGKTFTEIKFNPQTLTTANNSSQRNNKNLLKNNRKINRRNIEGLKINKNLFNQVVVVEDENNCQSYKNPSAKPKISKFLQDDDSRPRTADLNVRIQKRLDRRVQSATTQLVSTHTNQNNKKKSKHLSIPELQKEQCPIFTRSKITKNFWNKNQVVGRQILDLSDIELDLFINEIVPSSQYIIIFAYRTVTGTTTNKNHSIVPKTLKDYHHNTNKLRSKPCNQSKLDNFRLFKYNLNKNVLLIKRHNISPGSFLIYQNGRLLWMGQKFNGYSNNLWDLERQLEILDGKNKNLLSRCRSNNSIIPPDFKYQAVDRIQPVIEVGGDVLREGDCGGESVFV